MAAPAARRRLWLAVVNPCPHCQGLHVHRSGPERLFTGRALRACPATGRGYVLVVARVAGYSADDATEALYAALDETEADLRQLASTEATA